MIRGSSLSFAYEIGTNIVDCLDIEVKEGEIVALLGASGCGKSTLLRLLSGLLKPTEGAVTLQVDAKVGFVFQEPALMPWSTVAANVALPIKIKGDVNYSLISKALADVRLEGFENRYPQGLSGGQKMRVSIARALASKPDIIFFDEPFAALDEILRFELNDLLLQIRAERQIACVFVTHSLYEAAYLADRVLIMDEGVIKGEIVPGLNRAIASSAQRTSADFLKAVREISQTMGVAI